MYLKNKHILLGITGSIAAYKAPELIRLLQKAGATVQVMVTPSALEFVTTVTLEAISGYPLLGNIYTSYTHGNKSSSVAGQNLGEKGVMRHIQASRQADLVIIAPATANMLAKLAYGMADDLVSSTVLASNAPVMVAPAMNVQMWSNPIVQENVRKLRKAYYLIEPAVGYMACGEEGEGRLVDLEIIVHETIRMLSSQDLKNKKVLITAGATREYFDPVRFLSNASSGKMAFALAREAYYRGAEVIVVAGSVQDNFFFMHGVKSSASIKIIRVISAQDMAKAVLKIVRSVDVFIAAAAVADYRFEKILQQKYKSNSSMNGAKRSQSAMGSKWTPILIPTLDILQKVTALPKHPFTVGFALETQKHLVLARQKYRKKKVDLMVLNTEKAIGNDDADVTFFTSKGVHSLGFLSKEDISKNIFAYIVKSF